MAMSIVEWCYDARYQSPGCISFRIQDGIARVYVPGCEIILVREGEGAALSISVDMKSGIGTCKVQRLDSATNPVQIHQTNTRLEEE